MQIVMSSGHGKYIRGASGYLDEVDEARRVVEQVAKYLKNGGIDIITYHDDVSTSQNENLNRIVDFHNSKTRDLDVSVHFNAYETTSKPMGTECLYVTQDDLSADVAEAISMATGLPNRGPKKRTDLFFLNNTEEPAILIETCFVDSSADAAAYNENFDEVCRAIAEVIGDIETDDDSGDETEPPKPPTPIEPAEVRIEAKGPIKVYMNGELIYDEAPVGIEWMENITATEFAGSDDPQDSAYGTGKIDGDEPGIALPYKWRDTKPPRVVVEGPDGDCECPVVDVGPWNTDDPDYVLHGERPLAESQYEDRTKAQNGMVPSNDAGIDLTPETARMVGIEGKGKVRWKFA